MRAKPASNSLRKLCLIYVKPAAWTVRQTHFAARKSLPHSQFVNGAAAKKFQKKAMGKFLNTVPSHIAGRSVQGRWASTTLKTTDAIRLMLGHMTATVPP